MGDFGNKFRQAREEKNLSLDDVSNVTKIGARMLQAIEEEHFDQLPGGVFNKGFIRAYAKHLGLDAEDAVTDYLACLREAQIGAQEVWENVRPEPARAVAPDKSRVSPSKESKAAVKSSPAVQVEELPHLQLPRAEDIRPPRRDFPRRADSGIPWTILGAASLVVILAIFLWMRHSRSTHAAKPSPAPVAASNTAPSAPPVAPAVKPNPSPATAHPAKSATPPPPKPAPKPQIAAPAPSATTSPASSPATTNASPAPAPATTTPAEKPSLTLVIRASETSWISVQSDGQLIAQETLIAPAATSFHAAHQLVVRVGNAAGVTFLWNGEELPAQGAEAEVKTITFDASGVHVAAPPAPTGQVP